MTTKKSTKTTKQKIKTPKSKKSEGRRRATKSPSSDKWRASFSAGMTKWLESRDYQIGIRPVDVQLDDEVKRLKALMKFGRSLINTAMPVFISGGADSSQVFDAMVPFAPLADLLGFRAEGDGYVGLVIYADELEPDVIRDRLEKLLELADPLAELGIRMNGQSMSTAYVHVLLVYRKSENHARAVAALHPEGAKRNALGRTYLYTAFIDVPGNVVVWSREEGILGGIRRSMADFLGTSKTTLEIFTGSDLQSVLTLAKLKN